MTKKILLKGLDQVIQRLERLAFNLRDNERLQPWLEAIGQDVRRFAVSISPSATGSYRASHRVAVDGLQAIVGIDPEARNAVSGILVTEYAGDIEKKHQVYARSAAKTVLIVAKELVHLIKRIVV